MARKQVIMSTGNVNRRTFLKSALAASAAATLPMPAIARAGQSANEKVNLACVGLGHRGGRIARDIGGNDMVNVVAVCDVDLEHGRVADVLNAFPDAKRFGDFREMFDKMGNEIDAVTVGTPDHSHFAVAMLAMSMGKHVYIEKPLANSFRQSELLMAAEKKYNVAAQLGNQGFSGNNYFQFKAWTEAGIIRDVLRVDAFMNSRRRWHGWQVDGFPEGQTKPDSLNWDLWCATEEVVPYHGRLHPQNWRSWYRFGNGAFGDWGPHILDTIHHFLDLGLPTEIEAVKRDGPNDYIFPQATTIRFVFPARGEHPACEVYWYDGVNNQPQRPEALGERNLRRNGKLIYAKDLTFYGGTHGNTLTIIPDEVQSELHDDLPRDSARGHSGHSLNFIRACRGEEESRSPLHVSGLLAQVFDLGVIAQQIGGKLLFDPARKQFTNSSRGNELLAGSPPRKGWEDFYNL